MGEGGDRVGWNREQVLCFHPADPSVVEVVTNEDVQFPVLRSRNYLFSAPAPTLTIISAPAPAPATAIYWHFKLF